MDTEASAPSSVAALLVAFDAAWLHYLEQFAAWKLADAASLEVRPFICKDMQSPLWHDPFHSCSQSSERLLWLRFRSSSPDVPGK